MDKIRKIITVILIACVGFGWIITLSGNVQKISENNKNIDAARVFVEKGLYQKAIASYEEALAYKERLSIRDELLNAYKLGLDDGVIKSSDYAQAYLDSCNLYPKNTVYWETLLSYYLSVSSYSKAYDAYKMLVKAGAKSEELEKLSNQILYSYSVKPTNYSKFYRTVNGYYTICKNEKWAVLTPTAEQYSVFGYDYIIPMNSLGETVFLTDKDFRVYSFDGVVQNRFKSDINKANSIGSGLIPILSEDNVWKYFNVNTEEYITSEFENAATFSNGVAVAKTANGWAFINTNMESISETTFDDVKLFPNGEYVYKGIIVASVNKQYQLFDEAGKVLSDFSATDMDNYYGSYIAYKGQDGLWGFIDNKGKVVIEPKFKEAKSFSNGLAAVFDGENWGFIKMDGTLVIDYQYAFADYFTPAGMCIVGDEVDAYYFIELRFT